MAEDRPNHRAQDGPFHRALGTIRHLLNLDPAPDDVVELAKASAPTHQDEPSLQPLSKVVVIDAKSLVDAIAAAGTAIWRVRCKLQAAEALPDTLRNLPRHIESAWDVLRTANVEVRDPTGERYVSGMALHVIAFQPTAGLGTEVIQETLKPSVYIRDKLIQRGEVIVGTPMESDGCGPSAPPAEARTEDATPPGEGMNI